MKLTTYAVMKKGRKSALGVFGELAAAKTWCLDNNLGIFDMDKDGAIELNSNISIIERKGECIEDVK